MTGRGLDRRSFVVALVVLAMGAGCLGLRGAWGDGPAVATRTRVDVVLRDPTARRHLVCGHRGDFRMQEGNTIASFESGRRAGLDLIEIDVETTADGVPVIEHDPWPRTKNFADWQRRGRRLLTLARALAWAEPRGFPILVLDIKTPRLEAVVAAIREARAAGRVVAFVTEETAYHRLRFLLPDLDLMVRARDIPGARAWAARRDPKIVLIHGDYEWMHDWLVTELRAAGARTWVNSWKLTWDDEMGGAASTVGRVFRRGICVAQTNHPPTAVHARNVANRAAARR